MLTVLPLATGPAIAAAPIAVIPRPDVVTPGAGAFTLTAGTAIVGAEGTLLAEALRPATGLPLPVVTDHADNGAIRLQLHPMKDLEPEGAYTLDVTPDGVTIGSTSAAGLFYGGQTLRQLLPAAAFSPTPVAGVTWSVPCVHIEDRPRFPWRGMMLDCGRHYFPVPFVERFIDLLAVHKMNVFHWHLTDDQGWRLEIKRYPKLTEIGSKRAASSVPGPTNPKKRVLDPTPYGGFYTQQQVRAVVAYAAARHVTVVPEIEMPGHSRAAIAAYPELGVSGKPIDVGTAWGVEKHILNPNAATVAFYRNVLTEVMDLFPSTYIHVGGDEAPKDEWNHSPVVQAQINALGLKDADALQAWFIGQMDQFLSAHGRKLIGWDEILEGGLTPGAAVMSWHGDAGAVTAAVDGHDAVNASNRSMYFDYYQSKDHAREPFSIGGYLPLSTVYAFDPVPAKLAAGKQKFILGGQAQVWTEYIATPQQVEYMAYPRACALAECDWSDPRAKDYDGFLARLRVHMDRLHAMGVNARPMDATPANPQ